jgi:hypothetical protein
MVSVTWRSGFGKHELNLPRCFRGRKGVVSAYRRIGVSACRRVDVSACRRIGVSACRRVDVSAYRRVGVSACRRVGGSAGRDSTPTIRQYLFKICVSIPSLTKSLAGALEQFQHNNLVKNEKHQFVETPHWQDRSGPALGIVSHRLRG